MCENRCLLTVFFIIKIVKGTFCSLPSKAHITPSRATVPSAVCTPDHTPVLTVRHLLVPPGHEAADQSGAGRPLPLGLCGQPAAQPAAVGHRVIPGDVYDRVGLTVCRREGRVVSETGELQYRSVRDSGTVWYGFSLPGNNVSNKA